MGTSIEWYDFFLYGIAAALVFPQRFFPTSDPFTGALLAFSTFFVGFVSRPIGAAIFGHYGDRIGRRTSLVFTLVLMGVATFGIGLVPDYNRIGSWGAVLLTIGRVLQGIGVGGEWGGSVLLATEWGEDGRRGFMGSWPQFGAPAGLVLANGAVSLMTYVSGSGFPTWGWRVPFLASVVLVVIGLYIRIGILETPVFARIKKAGEIVAAPVPDVLRRHWREVALIALLRTNSHTAFYIFTTYVLRYGTVTLGLPQPTVLNYVLVQAICSLAAIPLFGHLSDVWGRRRIVRLGAAVMLVWPFVYFGLLDTRVPLLVFTAIVVALPLHDIQYGPQAALIAETFGGPLRYSGVSLGYQFASLTAGGPAPIIALWAYERYHTSMAIAAYLAVTAAVSLIALALLPDRSRVAFDR